MSSELSGLSGQDPVGANTAPWPLGRPGKWRENPERMAWFVLLASFAVFVVLAITVPLAMNYVMRYATLRQEARIEPTLGTLLLYPSPNAEAVAVTNGRDGISEGNRIVAGDDAQGTLAFIGANGPDEVLGTVQIYAGTNLNVLRIRRPMFVRSPEPYQVRLRLEKGQARIFSNSGTGRDLHVVLDTPHGMVELGAGSYQVSVNPERTDITVRSGQALLTHQDNDGISVDAGLRAWMTTDDFAHDPEPAEQNLLVNGDFSETMLSAWQTRVIADNVVPGSVRVVEREGRRVAHFIRQGEENVHTEVEITQVLDKDVNVYDSLTLQLDVKLLHQSLPGAGYLSSEFPLRVEIGYTDIYGNARTWGHGFYYRDPEDPNWRIVGGEKIPPFIWYTYQSPNLMELLQESRPARVNRVRIYASGWNYQSMVSEVLLSAE